MRRYLLFWGIEVFIIYLAFAVIGKEYFLTMTIAIVVETLGNVCVFNSLKKDTPTANDK